MKPTVTNRSPFEPVGGAVEVVLLNDDMFVLAELKSKTSWSATVRSGSPPFRAKGSRLEVKEGEQFFSPRYPFFMNTNAERSDRRC